MSHRTILFHHVTFSYDSAALPLFKDLSLHLSAGWCGIVGVNGSGKTTFLRLATGLLEPERGVIDRPARAVCCQQRTDEPPDRLWDFLKDSSQAAVLIQSRLNIHPDWPDRWETLSHGERKRAQIGTALWQDPEVLAVDEPTNHLDEEARAVLTEALSLYRGIGLLVSHDRELLDNLCPQCLFIDPPDAVLRPGGFTQGRTLEREAYQASRRQRDLKKRMYKKLEREAGRRRDLANQYQRRRSKKGIAKGDHGSKEKIDIARVSGKDIVGGKLLRQLDGRLAQARDEFESLTVKKQYDLGIWLPGSISPRDMLLRLPGGMVRLGEKKQLDYPPLTLTPTDRIALTGPNGSGKSTLLRRLLPHLNALPDHITYIPQEIDLHQSRNILGEVQRLPHEPLGALMTIIRRLGSRPQQLLESAEPSPGEIRKLLLALGMVRKPHIILMDEPTNHMDIASIECLEEALADCPCCLVLVSHDGRFLAKLASTEWRIRRFSATGYRYGLEICC